MTEQVIDYNYILNELVKAVKTLKLYPKGHPNLDDVLKICADQLRKGATEEGQIKWTIDSTGFFYKGKPLLQGHPGAIQIARDFFMRKTKEITFTPEFTDRDLKAFLQLLFVDHRELAVMGGAEVFLAKKELTGILLNEMRYEELQKLIDDLKEEDEEEEEELLEEIALDEEPVEEVQQVSLSDLIEQIDKEKDLLKYNELCLKIDNKITPLQDQKNANALFAVLKTFYHHTLPDAELPDSAVNMASSRVTELLDKAMLELLTEKLAVKEGIDFSITQQILLRGGVDTQKLLLDQLLSIGDAKHRRNVFNTLVLFGEELRPEIENRITDNRWFAVRQMVALLGELGGDESLFLLEKTYDHEDIRVKKEVLKAITRIPSHRSFTLLLEALKDKNKSIQGQAVISLGILKDPAAVEPLAEIATKRDTFNESIGLRKEAIKALGILGDPKAIPYLKSIVMAKIWIGKNTYDDLRSLSCVSLGKIGGPEAIEIITKASEKYSENIQNTCLRILEGMKT
ncbi:MAG: HEAT repeat domain-containing protein [Thermodesulfobacteriota bacterium]